jgi:hypothetical protein
MREVCVALPREIRNTLLRESDLSASAVAAIECPFDAALTAAVASEILAKCRKRGLATAAEILNIALSTLSSNGHYANGRPRTHDERPSSNGEIATSDCASSTSSAAKLRKVRSVSGA